MRRFGLVGYPLGHSFSRNYFSVKFEKEGLYDCRYDNFELPSIDELPSVICDELRGFNVTIPYKEQVFKYLDEISEEALQIGAVNCVKVTSQAGYQGKAKTGFLLKGYNSDVYGFEHSLKEMIRDTKIEHALVLGSGGASKAVTFVLKRLGIKFSVVSRNGDNNRITYSELTKENIALSRLIINTTPLGMHPNTSNSPDINYSAITATHFLYDLIYNPAQTLFLAKGREAGATVKSGYTMLAMQAEKGFEIFTK